MIVIADDARRARHRRRDGRRGHRLLRDDHAMSSSNPPISIRSASRAPAASSASFPTRAIASSAASIRNSCVPGSRTRDQAHSRMVRRRSLGGRRRRRSCREWRRTIDFDPALCRSGSAASTCRRPKSISILKRLGFAVEDGATLASHAAVLAQRRATARPTWSKKSCASTASTMCRRWR